LTKKNLIAIAILLIMASTVLAPATAQNAQNEFTFRFSLTEGAPKNFVQVTGGGPQQYISALIFDPLVVVDLITFDILPSLAETWDISSDGLTYTFHLTHNAKWHDGVPFTSADVKFTFDGIIEKKYDGYGFLQGITKIETPDDYTVVITLKKADAAFLIKVNGRYSGLTEILPKHILDGTDWTQNPFAQKPIGTGPYKFESYDGNKVVLVRNDDYFGGKPGFAKIEATVIPDVTLAMKAFENNDLDWLYGQVSSLSEYVRLKNLPGNEGASFFMFVDSLEFNVNKAPFDNLKVRQAFTYAIDRNELNQKIYLGQGVAQVNPVFPDWLKWAVSPDVKLPGYDPDMANRLLDEAGFTKGSDGTRFSMKISYASPYSPPPEFVDVLKSQLAKVGIAVEHEANEWDIWWEKVYKNKDFDVSLHHIIVVGDPEIGVTNEVDPNSFYYFGYDNPEVLNMYKSAAALTDRTKRAQIYAEIQKKLLADVPYFCLVDAPTPHLWKSTVTGILKGNNYGLRFAHPVAPATTTATTTAPTTATTTTTTEAAPGVDYTPYVALVAVIIVLLIGAYAYTKRKPKPQT